MHYFRALVTFFRSAPLADLERHILPPAPAPARLLGRLVAAMGERRADPATPTRRDHLLTRHLARAFERDLAHAALEGVQFYVRGGVVTLYGTVGHALDQRLVINLVRSVPGVQGVVAHLHVATPAGVRPS